MDGWSLPEEALVGGKTYHLHTDYRDILEIFSYLQDDSLPEFLRWQIALALFYEGDIPEEDFQEAAEYLRWFVCCGREEEKHPGPQLLSWEQDAQDIVADVNKVAGQEIRRLPYLHWWTFLSYFHALGEGQLSTLISIRTKLQTGKKLEPWEQDYYRKNRHLVDLRPRYTPEEMAQQLKLNQLLDP